MNFFLSRTFSPTFARTRWGAALAAACLLGLLLVPTSAFAHERRTIGNGKYDVVVGWDVEPAYQNQKNAASIRISEAGSNPAVPVEGAEKTLKIQIRQGASTHEFPLRAVFGQKGYYVADIVPTRVGDYQWTFTGSINGDRVNDTFDTADGKFNGVESISALQFPQALPDPAQTAAATQAAQADAQAARTIAYLGIGVGLVGVLLAGFAILRLRPRTLPPVATARPAIERI
jgi:hypothetical protein